MTTNIKAGEIYKANIDTTFINRFDELIPFFADEVGWKFTLINGKHKGKKCFLKHEKVLNHTFITQSEFDSIDWDNGEIVTKYEHNKKFDVTLLLKYIGKKNVVYHDNEGIISGKISMYENVSSDYNYDLNIFDEYNNLDFESDDISKIEVVDGSLHIWM